jgi:NAD(P)-dependent dehydrogenase (short-subunit alcohol dehydrogenase family)
MPQAKKVWFITGVSRGLGKDLAQALLDRGEIVVGTSRSGTADLDTGSGELHVLPLDLTAPDGARAAVERAHALHGRLDVIVNNAGFGLLGAVEEADEVEAEQVFQVNFFGPLRVIRAALPLLRARRGGHVVNVSSIAGLAPMAGSGLYAATKFALEGMSESLAQEVAPLGIRVTLVEPGAFRTDFLSPHSLRVAARRIEDYAPTSGKVVRRLETIAGRQLGDPFLAARAIIEAVESPAPPLHLVLGSDALERARTKLRRLRDELDRWEPVSRGTDYLDANA